MGEVTPFKLDLSGMTRQELIAIGDKHDKKAQAAQAAGRKAESRRLFAIANQYHSAANELLEKERS